MVKNQEVINKCVKKYANELYCWEYFNTLARKVATCLVQDTFLPTTGSLDQSGDESFIRYINLKTCKSA